MKATTLWQPWAQFMALGFKRFETRGMRCHHRGELAIHAGQHQPPLSHPLRVRMRELGMDPDKKYPKGVVLAVVELYDVLPTVDVVKEATAFGELLLGNYQPNRFAYLTRNLRMLAEPVPCKGKQAITWDLPADVEQKVRRQLQHLKDIERMKEATTTPLDVYVSLVKGGF